MAAFANLLNTIFFFFRKAAPDTAVYISLPLKKPGYFLAKVTRLSLHKIHMSY
jgi:hypothetical protein